MKRALLLTVCFAWFMLGKPVDASAAQAYAVIDAETGRLLDGRNEDTPLPIASLTKIWTAFTYLESGVESGEITISPAAASSEGSSIYLKSGTAVQDKTLLYGLMLRSGNDAAHALAEHAGGSVEGFVQLMQEKAILHGLDRTVFTNPSGLHNEQHLSTAYETGLMLRYAMENETFREIATTKKHVYQNEENTYHWQNKHRLLHSEPTAVAGKTGFTKAAGRTLATYFEKDRKKIIVVTLNDPDDWTTHLDLADKAFSTYKRVTIAKKGVYKIFPGVQAELEEPIELLMKKGEQAKLSNLVQIPRGKRPTATGIWTVSFDNEPIVATDVIIRQKR
ncbi:D-alanyl-D-alanine carboxypeptidase family protein [Sporosarcina sp. FSL W7-1349]|uniref:D-alanyl-D-alanine carboxypeptidase family protein n=1 Tax=Sporosarcina sp. FSL W7-1349 TaxID=2921561 RepID=UPI0030F8AF84